MLPALFLSLAAALSPGGDPAPAAAPTPWGADYFPNVELTTHEGKSVRFFDDLIRDKVVVVNFIYTSCPDACPLETARLAEVQDALGERVGHDVFFYSISIDPARDTVAALAEYAERFQIRPGWLFLRGSEEDVTLLRHKLGVLGGDETELQDHSLSLVLGNQATGRWMRRSPFENAHILADEIGQWLHNWKDAPVVEHDYSEAPTLRSITRGESLFRTRCSACHAIGPSDGLVRVGPNLRGVTKLRDPAWLARWIAEPDAMLSEGDALATALFEQYRRVPMPNMRLNALEVSALLEFLAEEDARLGAEAVPSAPAVPAPPSCCVKDEVDVVVAEPAEAPLTFEPAASLESSPPPRRGNALAGLAKLLAPLLVLGLGLGLLAALTRPQTR
jgi:protein SCO1/2